MDVPWLTRQSFSSALACIWVSQIALAMEPNGTRLLGIASA